MTKTELLMQAVVAALDGAGKPAGAVVDRNRRQPTAASELPRISVERLDEGVEKATASRSSPLVDRRLRIAVVSRIAGADAALDPFSQWAVQALMADQSLGGLAAGIDEQAVNWEYDEDSQVDYSVEARTFQIRYVTRAGDLTL